MRAAVHKKVQLFKAWATGSPVWCAWQVTDRCNFQCRFCNYWADPRGDQPDLPPERLERGARKLAQLGSLLISLAGGEPLLRPDIVDVVRAIGRWHFPFITTNGWLASPELARELFDAGLWGVSVSIDYADAELHDAQRGRAGAFQRALEAIEHFSAARRYAWQRVNWMSVLIDDNLDHVERMIRMAGERGAYFMIQPYGVRKLGTDRFKHRGPSVAERLVDLRRRYPNFLSNPYFLSRFDQALNGGVPDCLAGRGFFNIDTRGDIAVCVEECSRPVANLFTHGPREIVRALRQDPTPSRCQACWYNCRGEIESLYKPQGLFMSLPTLLFDRGRAPRLPR